MLNKCKYFVNRVDVKRAKQVYENLYHQAKKRLQLELKKIQFRTTVYGGNSRNHSVYLEPQNKMNVLNNFLVRYRTSDSVQILITELKAAIFYEKPKLREITLDECHVYIDSKKAIFDMEVVTRLKPIEIEINSAIEFFKLYKEYLIKYESNQSSSFNQNLNE